MFVKTFEARNKLYVVTEHWFIFDQHCLVWQFDLSLVLKQETLWWSPVTNFLAVTESWFLFDQHCLLFDLSFWTAPFSVSLDQTNILFVSVEAYKKCGCTVCTLDNHPHCNDTRPFEKFPLTTVTHTTLIQGIPCQKSTTVCCAFYSFGAWNNSYITISSGGNLYVMHLTYIQ